MSLLYASGLAQCCRLDPVQGQRCFKYDLDTRNGNIRHSMLSNSAFQDIRQVVFSSREMPKKHSIWIRKYKSKFNELMCLQAY